jgi:hypothetical protein
MWDSIAAEVWSHFEGEWGMISAAPASFAFAVLVLTCMVSYVIYQLLENRSREQRAIMTATIEHQRELLAGHREREEKVKETIEEIKKRPEFRLVLMGGDIFVTDSDPKWTGLALGIRIWNTGAPSVTVSWSLAIAPKGQTPVLAQWSKRPEQIRAGGIRNSAIIRASEGIDLITAETPVNAIPIQGNVVFYTDLEKSIVTHPDTWLELSVKDIYEHETIARQKMGDWLHR